MSEIKRRKNESFEAFMRRVKRRWQQSGKLLHIKKIRFFAGKKSKNMRRRSALHRLAVAEKIKYLAKIGRLPEELVKKSGKR